MEVLILKIVRGAFSEQFYKLLILNKLAKWLGPTKKKARQLAAALFDTFIHCVLYRIANQKSKGILAPSQFLGSAQMSPAIWST